VRALICCGSPRPDRGGTLNRRVGERLSGDVTGFVVIKGQEKGKAVLLCSRTPSETARNTRIRTTQVGIAPPAARGTGDRKIGARNKLIAWEIWLLSLDSNQEPSG
jgi:hypothetical protein